MAATTLGISLRAPYDQLASLARTAEESGFATAWVAENVHESMLQAAVVAGATTRIGVGTNVTLAFPRSPTITAMQAWDLATISGDRFTLGLGSQVRRIIEDRFSAEFSHPARRMAEYLQAVRTAWRIDRGESVTFDGDFYRVLRPGIAGPGEDTGRPLPRVLLAAVGPHMTRTAITHADGMIGHPFTSVRFLAEHLAVGIEEGLAQAGRAREAFTVAQGLIVSISEDRESARLAARQQVAFYGTTPNYRQVFEADGEGWRTDELRSTFSSAASDPRALAALVPDEILDRHAVAGTAEEVRDRLETFARHVDHLILGTPWFGLDRSRIAEGTAAILSTFARPTARA